MAVPRPGPPRRKITNYNCSISAALSSQVVDAAVLACHSQGKNAALVQETTDIIAVVKEHTDAQLLALRQLQLWCLLRVLKEDLMNATFGEVRPMLVHLISDRPNTAAANGADDVHLVTACCQSLAELGHL